MHVPQSKTTTVMVVDDSRFVRDRLCKALEGNRYAFLIAEDGLTAFQLACEAIPDVILLDVEMPVMSGDEALQRLKACDTTKEIPVLMVTSSGDDKTISKMLEIGAVDYITKPFSAEIVRARVRNAVRTNDALVALRSARSELEQRVARRTEELELAKVEAETATKAKSDFLANMSHELRTPMTAILGFAESLHIDRNDPQSPEQRAEAVGIIIRNAEHLLNLINDILDLSKIEARKMKLEEIECSPFQIVDDVKSLLMVRASAKNIELRVDIQNALPETIKTDPTRLRQILVNLLGNAIKFTEEGSVRLEVTHVVGADNSVGLRFDVFDTGIGMSEQQIAGLFEPFRQSDSSTSRRFGGTGLGLSISRRLARMLNGDITVTSRLGEGSCFRLTVMVKTVENSRWLSQKTYVEEKKKRLGIRRATEHYVDLSGCRVLLAEDGPDNQRLISFILTKAGADVTVVEDGQLAYERAVEFAASGRSFDIILMDMQMPVLDGYLSTRQLREAGYSGTIIALTAHAMEGDRKKCLDTGCDDYATKPIDRPKLLNLIKKYSPAPCPDGA